MAAHKHYAVDYDSLMKESEFCREHPELDPIGSADGRLPLDDPLTVDRESSPVTPSRAEHTGPALASALPDIPSALRNFNLPGVREPGVPLSRARERAPSRELLESFHANITAGASKVVILLAQRLMRSAKLLQFRASNSTSSQ